jgi:hypothetical protein
MHRSASRIAALGIVALILLGCTAQPGPGLSLGEAPWKDGDKAVYDWVNQSGNKIGTSVLSFAKDGTAWVLTATDKIGSLDQTNAVRVDGSTLKPLGEEKRVKAQGTDATVTTTYQNGKLEIKATVNGEPKSATMDVPSDSLDNDQLIATLRALKFADGYEGKYVNVNGGSATKLNTTVRVVGKEKVTVPAGSFDAWKVELDFAGQAKQYAWYQVEAPSQLVQYDNGATKMVLTK